MVPSWRDSASSEAQADLDALLNATLPFAQQMLDQHGEFLPFAAAVSKDGGVTMVAGEVEGTDRPPSQEVLDTLLRGLRESQSEYRAVALVADVLADGNDAVRVELEHAQGQAITVLLPYKRKKFRRSVEYGSLAAATGRQQVWIG